MSRLLDGRSLARRLYREEIRPRAEALPRPPGLGVVIVGGDPASRIYVATKARVAGRLGLHHVQVELPATATQERVEEAVAGLVADQRIDGVLVQLPLPAHLDARRVLDAIDPRKDVDGFHPSNAGLLVQGRPRFVPCTPLGVMRLIGEAMDDLSGRVAVVVGRSQVVGLPVASLLLQAHCTVTTCHSRTAGLAEAVGRAEILVAAVGRPGLVRSGWVRPGAIAVDVGINRLPDGSLAGDIEPAAADRAAWITPVPGGVGPMTIAMLMSNTVLAAERRLGRVGQAGTGPA